METNIHKGHKVIRALVSHNKAFNNRVLVPQKHGHKMEIHQGRRPGVGPMNKSFKALEGNISVYDWVLIPTNKKFLRYFMSGCKARIRQADQSNISPVSQTFSKVFYAKLQGGYTLG